MSSKPVDQLVANNRSGANPATPFPYISAVSIAKVSNWREPSVWARRCRQQVAQKRGAICQEGGQVSSWAKHTLLLSKFLGRPIRLGLHGIVKQALLFGLGRLCCELTSRIVGCCLQVSGTCLLFIAWSAKGEGSGQDIFLAQVARHKLCLCTTFGWAQAALDKV